MDLLLEGLRALVGPDYPAQPLNLVQMVVRAALVYAVALLILRVAHRRLLGRNAALDIIMGFILGSLLSRAINGSAPLFETLGAALVLVALHGGFAVAAFRAPRLEALIKGHDQVLIRDGQLQHEQLRRADISESDLREALRLEGKLLDPAQVELACLERNGRISVIPRAPAGGG